MGNSEYFHLAHLVDRLYLTWIALRLWMIYTSHLICLAPQVNITNGIFAEDRMMVLCTLEESRDLNGFGRLCKESIDSSNSLGILMLLFQLLEQDGGLTHLSWKLLMTGDHSSLILRAEMVKYSLATLWNTKVLLSVLSMVLVIWLLSSSQEKLITWSSTGSIKRQSDCYCSIKESEYLTIHLLTLITKSN